MEDLFGIVSYIHMLINIYFLAIYCVDTLVNYDLLWTILPTAMCLIAFHFKVCSLLF